MYELPEIELVRANLTERFSGIAVKKVYIDGAALLGKRVTFLNELTLASIWFVERRSGHLILHLDSGKRVLIEIGKNTKYFADDTGKINKDHASLILSFEGKAFAFYDLDEDAIQLLTVREVDQQLKVIAPDAFDKGFTLAYFTEQLAKKRSSIKNALIDGKIVTAIDSIYSDEALFEAKLYPTRKASSLLEAEVKRLYDALIYILKEAVTDGGSSATPISGQDVFSGSYRDKHKVFEKQDDRCERCKQPIEQIVLTKQKCYICAQCQS